MKIIIKTTKIILNIITTLIIVLGLSFVILFAVGIQPYVVESGSMEPAIKTKSVCFINKRANYKDMRVGDIIAFKLPNGASATHRIVEINESGMITKGDANANVDSVVTTESTFVGKNILSIPKAGNIVKKVQTPRGKILIGTVVLLFFAAGILIGEPSKKKEKNTNTQVQNTEPKAEENKTEENKNDENK